ncbi:Ankyrin and IPT/TIG repeat-containing protein C26H5,05 [Schizosaccharomyces pombe 972h-] [Rhizoctonia solani]|uniref:Ankyrin and IPT/TIG repeat-containing protein C26H5,05 [Schizosaccharomyces pombe 972h-] n=1 Tax=Rhizoctonia solani TaxID=456999 RepID=A0A0K6FN16_9AGAM|nr:Ankyrin and IPT/TIG repeat-containing protein C26H5,05 [Schizosaccharomyces pombe 972h-] [Rhizoctonia solani]
MPRTLAGDAQNDMGPCDPRCTLENHKGQSVSKRVRKACTRRLNDLERRQANARQSEQPGLSSQAHGLSEPQVPVFDFSGYVMQSLVSNSRLPPQPSDKAEYMDTTMPTWGLSVNFDTNDVNISEDSDTAIYPVETDADEALDYDMDGASDADSESSDIEPPVYLSSPAAYDYASDSDHDFDAGIDAGPSVFDQLYSISPGSSQESLFEPFIIPPKPASPNSTLQAPIVPEDNPDTQGDDYERAAAAPPQPQPRPDASPDVPPALSPDPEPPKVLPDALRAFREWVLSHSSTGDLTVDAANSFLKTLDFCLEKDLLRCGAETNPEHRLPLTLETLQRHAKIQANLADIFAVCPDFSCQTLRRLASMSPDRPYICEKCGKTITRRKITRRRARKPLEHYVPILQYTYCPIVEQLKEILSRPGIWKAIDEHRQHLKREGMDSNTLEDIQHGEIWLKLKKDGELFFGDTNNIGFILMCDWFQPNSRQGAPSYSTGVISLCIANLPPHLRNRPENKIMVGVIPGPHEPNVDTINNFLEPMVHELLSLWDKGVSIDDPDNNTPRNVCAALVACACDSPAARKLGGFPGTGGTYPCTVCWCSHKELHIFDRMFPKRTRHEHKRAAKVYSKLPNKAQRQKFLTKKFEDQEPGGYRPSILLDLPYWNPEKMVIIDPMHCLFLGLVDWQFHTIWIEMKHLRPEKELAELQKMVQSTLRPRHCGKPPSGLGTSSAGSLTADPLRSLITIDLPLAIPILWDQVDIRSVDQRAHEEWAKRKQIQEKKQAEARQGDKITRAATKA